jgi:hypothetical protein
VPEFEGDFIVLKVSVAKVNVEIDSAEVDEYSTRNSSDLFLTNTLYWIVLDPSKNKKQKERSKRQ